MSTKQIGRLIHFMDMKGSEHGNFFRLYKNQVFYVLGLIVICFGVYLAVQYLPQMFLQQNKQTTPQEILDFLKTSNPAQPAPDAIINTLKNNQEQEASPPPNSIINFLKK